ncbi:MAG: tetratricopeptide repeat protein [Candidatus Eremiobacteraeota bacterium]|nr:tetratricopeptide repeat protein [Candidatus Eremiobacteraeota bacterium]
MNPDTLSPGMTVNSPKTDEAASPTKSSPPPFPSFNNQAPTNNIQPHFNKTNPNNEIRVSKNYKARFNLFGYYKWLASLSLIIDKKEMAVEYYTKAIEVDPDNYEGYDYRSKLYYKMGEHEKGIVDCNKGISIARKRGVFEKLCPNRTLSRRGAHYLNLKKYDEAIKDFNFTIKYRPNFAFAYYDRGRCYLRKGDYESARKDFLKSIKLDKNNILTESCRDHLKEMEEMRK